MCSFYSDAYTLIGNASCICAGPSFCWSLSAHSVTVSCSACTEEAATGLFWHLWPASAASTALGCSMRLPVCGLQMVAHAPFACLGEVVLTCFTRAHTVLPGVLHLLSPVQPKQASFPPSMLLVNGPTAGLLQGFGVGAAAVGTTISVYALARLMMNLPAGMLADSHGRKPLLVWGPAITALGELRSIGNECRQMCGLHCSCCRVGPSPLTCVSCLCMGAMQPRLEGGRLCAAVHCSVAQCVDLPPLIKRQRAACACSDVCCPRLVPGSWAASVGLAPLCGAGCLLWMPR